MLCQKCNLNEATVHIRRTVNGVKSEMMLCSKCAGSEGGHSFFGDDLFSGFFSDSILGMRRAEEQKKCPVCGLTRRELASSGRAGCAKCYEYFAPELDKIIYGIHGNARHNGVVPGAHAEQIEKQRRLDGIKAQIEELRKEQQTAIAEQNYEKAAELRDKIKALSEEGGQE